tara:strand:+ start:3376 stop:5229 length:1854 start_codon:yes stop_codon:yes gene_type:complete
MNRQLLKEISRLQTIMGVQSRTKQLISEQWKNAIGGIADVIGLFNRVEFEDIVKITDKTDSWGIKGRGYARIDWTKVKSLGLSEEASDLLRVFDDELKVSEDIVGTPARWKNNMGDLTQTFERADDLLADMISKGTSSADVIRGINRMKAAGRPSKFVEQVADVDDFWVILQTRLSNTGQSLNKETVASVLDLPPNSSAVDDVFDELLLYERTDDLIADLNRTNRAIDDVIGGGGKTIRGDKGTIISIGGDAAGAGKAGGFGKHIRKNWWRYIIGTLAADSIFGDSLGLYDWYREGETSTKINQAFNIGVKESQPVWRQKWEQAGMTEKWKKEYLFDSKTTYPTGTLLAIVEWLDKQIGSSSRWNLSDIKETEIASLYGGPQFPNVVPAELLGTGGNGIINSILKASQVAWAWDKMTTGTGTKSLYEQMNEVMVVRAGGIIGKGIAKGIGDTGFEAVAQKVNGLTFGYDAKDDGDEEDKQKQTEKEYDKEISEGMPNFIGRKTQNNSGVKEVYCCNFPSTAQVPPAVAWKNYYYVENLRSGQTPDSANKLISASKFNEHFRDVYKDAVGFIPAYVKNPPGQKNCENIPEGKIGDFKAQVQIFNQELKNKIEEESEGS